MVKKAGPDLLLDVPPLKKCGDCKGLGKTKGMFYELECHACNATGVLNKETGEQVEQGAVIRAMRKHIRKLNAQIEQLKKHQPEFDPYGELKGKDGGKYRGD